jgi:hypothetical protein
MANTPYHSTTLRYVDADRLDNRVLDLDGLDVKNSAGDHLGDVDGFLVDAASGRPRYIVVDSGGWFSSRRFLVPVHHARVDAGRRALRVDFDRDTINRFPRLEEDRFDAVTDDEARSYDQGVMHAWESSALYVRDDTSPLGYEAGIAPAWWNASAWMRDADRVQRDDGAFAGDTRGVREDTVMARDEDAVVDDRPGDEYRAPAYGERAQPGDILGIESGGERTSIGDTARDEDKRREDAERAFEKDRKRR